ncbi:AraC family transcriptional regulator [Mycolicibacter heraklionensis]|uniref:AraC family transcriptional regulator n=1 Tax=Mycolicibacter heraklionensis TaxID=512402 RepID=A0ABR5FJZ7_9MYCO|nr:AraC family transcriptional regulator [Mycolicibacter heraklionensis]KLO31355.1 AraC family transcriptional regulator [Mycolicibacter heraklionensis]
MSTVPDLDTSPTNLQGRERRTVVCATDDFDVYRDTVNDVYYPARLELVGPDARLTDAQMSAFRLTDLTIGIVHFGAEVSIDPGDMGGYHVDMPLVGSAATRCGAQELIATPNCAAVYSPGEHTVVNSWPAATTQVSIKIDRTALERELACILGRPVDQRVRFDIGFDLTAPAGARWRSMIQLLLDTVARPGFVPDAALAAQTRYLERAVIAGLLAGQPHSMSDVIRRGGTRACSSALRKVVDLIAEAPGAQYTVVDLAEAAGVGVRQLQKLFRDEFDTSPAQYLRNARLDGARADLIDRSDTVTVSEVAYRWGFNHLGRFALHYERRFGETPSRTLRNR